ncbi:uncharacterized protein TrAFT101_010424 [Trichoderma asperellum]|uniref:uncharacterized protein n=1 Tax=Trichoderma asperellum TaxID=101201 RepID=UPI003331428C|nr:hypothetical protein TrAFT101_010424 [Trichoderma asperellum]
MEHRRHRAPPPQACHAGPPPNENFSIGWRLEPKAPVPWQKLDRSESATQYQQGSSTVLQHGLSGRGSKF